MQTVIVTGSSGLIGSEACKFFHSKNYRVIGIDNDMRSYFFGAAASTSHVTLSLQNRRGEHLHKPN